MKQLLHFLPHLHQRCFPRSSSSYSNRMLSVSLSLSLPIIACCKQHVKLRLELQKTRMQVGIHIHALFLSHTQNAHHRQQLASFVHTFSLSLHSDDDDVTKQA